MYELKNYGHRYPHAQMLGCISAPEGGSLQKVFELAKSKANILKKASKHTLRHSCATHLLKAGTDIHLIQTLLGHSNIKTTLIYLHVSNKSIANVKSPLDDLF